MHSYETKLYPHIIEIEIPQISLSTVSLKFINCSLSYRFFLSIDFNDVENVNQKTKEKTNGRSYINIFIDVTQKEENKTEIGKVELLKSHSTFFHSFMI